MHTIHVAGKQTPELSVPMFSHLNWYLNFLKQKNEEKKIPVYQILKEEPFAKFMRRTHLFEEHYQGAKKITSIIKRICTIWQLIKHSELQVH